MKPIRIFPKEFLAQQAICYSSSLPGAEVEKLDPGKLQPREGRESFQTNNCSSLPSYVGISKKIHETFLEQHKISQQDASSFSQVA